jgi:hypothetical protein
MKTVGPKMGKRMLVRLALLAFLVAGAPALWPWAYTNSGIWSRMPAPKGYRAIDLLVSSNQAVFAGAGKKISTTPDGANATLAGDMWYNDQVFYWVDIGHVITPLNRALGFVDCLVTVEMEDAPGVSVSGPGIAPYTNGWRMYGDSDRKGSQDLRANADGRICEFIDDRFKSQNLYNISWDNTLISIMQTWGIRNSVKTYYAGEYGIMRMEVPRDSVRSYALYLGQNVLRPYPANINYGNGPGDQYDGRALSYQCVVYVPVLTNAVIPAVHIKSPAVDGVFVARYDDNANVWNNPIRELRVPARVPIVFSGERSYVSNVNIVSWEWQVDTAHWVPGGPTYTAFFPNNGNYQVLLRVRTDNGLVAVNNGISNETGSNNMPDLCPSALPTVVTVVDPPNLAGLQECRPNPFIIGQHMQAVLDFTLAKDMAINISVFSLSGHLVRNLLTSQGKYPAGYWSALWDGKDDRGNYATEGVYYGVLSTSAGTFLNKIHVLRVK